jgi:hypothetical protein
MLCSVMAITSSVVRCHGVFTPSIFDGSKLRCRWGRVLSSAKINNAPAPNPTAAGSHPGTPMRVAMAIDGARSDQKLAATITPPVKPSMASSERRVMFGTTSTTAAPAAVTSQVKVVAISAPTTGSVRSKKARMGSIRAICARGESGG